MKKFLLLGITALMSAGAGLALSKTANVEKEELNANIIVQLKSPLANKTSKKLLAEQSAVISNIHNEITTSYEIGSRFTNVLNAFQMKVNASHVSAIRNLPGVKTVEYNTYREVSTTAESLIKRDAVTPTKVFENISAETMNIPSGTNEGEGTLIAILDSSFMIHANSPVNNPLIPGINDLTHTAFTAMDSSIEVKYTQESIKAVIDGAEHFNGKYDDTHSTYLNNKVPFYYDYGGDIEVEDPYDDNNPDPGPDYDVYTEGSDHGNHVASIAAGNDPYYKGIAPKAQLALMKVFTATTYYQDVTDEEGNTKRQKVISVGAMDDRIFKALEDVAILKADVYNMSLGSALREFNGSELANEAITNLEAKGIVGSISAGNEGKEAFATSAYEYWTTDMVETGILGSYALNEAGMIIAASEPDKKYYDTALVVGTNVVAFKDQIKNSSTQDFLVERSLLDLLVDYPDGKFNWVKVPGLGSTDDFKELGEKKDKPLAGKIAVIDRGEINFSVKVRNSVDWGAIACAIIDNDPTVTDFNFTMNMGGYSPEIPVVSFLYRDGAIFGKAKDTGTCELIKEEIKNNPVARQAASYSSDGPTYDLRMKADITTPGSDVFGAVYNEDKNNSYDYYSGTSMAAPNYAGVYALMLSEDLNNNEWRHTINERLMTAATPMMDKYGEDKTTHIANHESVRKQGAGLVNVKGALETEVLLDGSADPEHLLNRTKIELKNNDDIKNGRVNLNFTTISSATGNIEYTATLYVYKPLTGKLDSEHFGEKFEDVTLLAQHDLLLKKVTTALTVETGTHTAHVEYNLTESEKAALDETFENGCYIEGFVVLEAEGKTTISIPYLGFYGDYDQAAPVEPFKFERDENKVYQSDLLNHIGTKWKGLIGCDFASDWVMGNWDSLKDLDLTNYLYNETFFRDILDTNKNKVVPVGTNPYTGKIETNDIYMGNNGMSNTMIIAQFVTRTVETNTLTITNKATGEVVLVDHMFDSLSGALEDENGDDYQWPLYKSHLNVDYWSNGLLAHRAYTIIPLYNYEYDEVKEEYNIGENYPDGEYEIEINYLLHSGGTYKLKYNLHIDSKAPQIENIEKVNNNEYLRLRFDEEKFSYLSINGYKKEISKDENGYYFDAKISDYAEKDKMFIKAYDFSYGTSGTLLHVSDEDLITVSSPTFTNAFDFTTNLTKDGKHALSLSFSYLKSNKSAKVTGDINVSINLSRYLYTGAETKVYTVDKDGKKSEIAFTLEGNTAIFSGDANATYYINCDVNGVAPEGGDEPVDPDEPVEPEPDKSAKKGCGGSIIASSAILSITAALGACLMFIKRKLD
ncbi:MAG: S8 family serine peptidase [Bacilli bacterium]|nr:S8 family serine peptidase [Bacilli bacterium]